MRADIPVPRSAPIRISSSSARVASFRRRLVKISVMPDESVREVFDRPSLRRASQPASAKGGAPEGSKGATGRGSSVWASAAEGNGGTNGSSTVSTGSGAPAGEGGAGRGSSGAAGSSAEPVRLKSFLKKLMGRRAQSDDPEPHQRFPHARAFRAQRGGKIS